MHQKKNWSSPHWLCAAIAVFFVQIAAAQLTIRVPADLPSIQAAIDAAINGDKILVKSGIYRENINFLGKSITVQSEHGSKTTKIDGRANGSVVTFSTGEGRSSVLRGFTLTNGMVETSGGGGGITILEASPTIEENRITNNRSCEGAGININSGSPMIRQNNIDHNTRIGCIGGVGGAGILIEGEGSAAIVDNVISDNFLETADGGGIAMNHAGSPS
jgi:serine protease